MNIYVGNLPQNIGEEDLRELFGEYGQVDSVKIIKDFQTGRPKGFGFVDMSQEDGQKAVEALNESDFNGNTLIVNEAFERRQNNYRDNNRGGYNRNNNYRDSRDNRGYRN